MAVASAHDDARKRQPARRILSPASLSARRDIGGSGIAVAFRLSYHFSAAQRFNAAYFARRSDQRQCSTGGGLDCASWAAGDDHQYKIQSYSAPRRRAL